MTFWDFLGCANVLTLNGKDSDDRKEITTYSCIQIKKSQTK